MIKQTYYEMLGISPEADAASIQQAYWRLARRYQGVSGEDLRSKAQLEELNEAYGVLSAAASREHYDTRLAAQASATAPHNATVEARSTSARNPAAPRPARRQLDAVAPSKTGVDAGEQTGDARQWPLVAAVCGSGAAGVGVYIAAGLAGVILIAGISAVCVLGAAAWAKLGRAPSSTDVGLPVVEPPAVREPAPGVTWAPPSRLGSAGSLHASTSAMVGRWRKNARGYEARTPDTTLVDIFRSERAIDDADEPLTGVMDVLRRSREAVRS
jgi:hypothetical protein